jgi:hypothetical protein
MNSKAASASSKRRSVFIWIAWLVPAVAVSTATVLFLGPYTASNTASGQVVEYETNKPLAGVKVIMQFKGNNGNPVISQYGCWKVDVYTTDEHGYYTYQKTDDGSAFPTFIYKPGYVYEDRRSAASKGVYPMKIDNGTVEGLIGKRDASYRTGIYMNGDPFGNSCSNYYRKHFRDRGRFDRDAYDLGICHMQLNLSKDLYLREPKSGEANHAFGLYADAISCMEQDPSRPALGRDSLRASFSDFVKEGKR